MILPRRFPRFVLALTVLAAAGFVVKTQADDKKTDEATTLATKLLDEGATEFSRKNAKVMARFYTEDADLRVVTRDSGGLKTDGHHGRNEIEAFYAKLFESDEKYVAKNEVEVARFLSKDLLVISGVFTPNTEKDLKIQFVQVRQKVEKNWLIRDMQVFFVPDQD